MLLLLLVDDGGGGGGLMREALLHSQGQTHAEAGAMSVLPSTAWETRACWEGGGRGMVIQGL